VSIREMEYQMEYPSSFTHISTTYFQSNSGMHVVLHWISGTQIDPEMDSCILTQSYMDTLIAELCPKYYSTESYGRSMETCMRSLL
jgi:hypothetical protein